MINLSINSDEANINDFLYCWSTFETRPNRVKLHNNYSTSLFFENIGELSIENNFSEVIPDGDDDYIINDKSLLKITDTIYLSYVILDKIKDDSIIGDVTFFYKESSDIDKVNSYINKISDCLVSDEVSSITNLNKLVINNGNLELRPIDLKISDDTYLYYNSKTFKSVNKLIKKLGKSKNSLNILKGDKGTGKTSILHYISSKVDKTFVYIPTSLIDVTINNPEFNGFISSVDSPVFILDDCEFILSNIYSKSNMIANNLIQILDGLDSMKVDFITIFNTEEDIDDELMDVNCEIEEVIFNHLSTKESNDLSEHLSNKTRYKNKSRLIDIIKNRNSITNTKIGLQ